jgi:Flp pilus assembly protein TadD
VTTDNAVAHAQLGIALFEQGRTEGAVVELGQAVRLAPGFPDPHFNLVRAMLQVGRLAEGSRLAEDERSAWPADARTHVNLGLAASLGGRIDEAAASFTEALRLDPDSADAHLNLGAIRAVQGRTAEAVTHFEAVLAQNPGDPDARRSLAQIRSGQPVANPAQPVPEQAN